MTLISVYCILRDEGTSHDPAESNTARTKFGNRLQLLLNLQVLR
jgi:hypothetical protein